MTRRKKQRQSDRLFEAGRRTLDAVALMHQGFSLKVAAREAGTTSATVLKQRPAALHKSKTGRWVVNKNDPYVRMVEVHTARGPITVRVRGYNEAKLASDYLVAVSRWGRTRKSSELASFRGKTVGGVPLLRSTLPIRVSTRPHAQPLTDR